MLAAAHAAVRLEGLEARVGVEALLAQQLRASAPPAVLQLAQPAHEPLGHDALHARGDQVRLDAHLDQPRGGQRRVVGVQRA